MIGGTPVTTGRFTATNAKDLSAPFQRHHRGTSVPRGRLPREGTDGSDLSDRPRRRHRGDLDRALSRTTRRRPFTLKPLAGPIAADAIDHVTYSIPSNLASFPTGTATIQ